MSIQSLAQQHSLPEDAVAELKSAFDLFDQDRDGTIDIDELVNIFEALDVDVKPSRSELRAMVAEVDADGNEELDFEEFLQLMSSQITGSNDSNNHIRNIFKRFTTQNGFMTANDLLRAMEKLCGVYLSKKDIMAMLKYADKDGDGRLSESEFIMAIQNIGDYEANNKDYS